MFTGILKAMGKTMRGRMRRPTRHEIGRVMAYLRPVLAVAAALMVAGILIAATGDDPFAATAALVRGAFGSSYDIEVGLNKTTPYLLTAVGIALCFRGKIINLGAEGQIALGGLGATWVVLTIGAGAPSGLLILLAMAVGAAVGALWSGLAAAIHLKRRIHEILVTLLSNFVAILIVAEALHGTLGETGAGFPQSPLFPREAWLPALRPGGVHVGFIVAVAAAVAAQFVLNRTIFGFRIRLLGASRPAATYSGVSPEHTVLMVMLLAGGLAGLAGALEVLGFHYRLIEGFSTGFGFKALAIALLAGTIPLAAIPASLFFGFLEAGALSMQRETGVNSALVFVIQGLTILFVLSAMGIEQARRRQEN